MTRFTDIASRISSGLARGLLAGAIGLLALIPAAGLTDGIDDDIETLPDLHIDAHEDLQPALEKLVREQGLWNQVKERNLALGLVDITDIDAPRYAVLNPHHMMYAASLPKIAILLGAYVEITDGELKLDAGLKEAMTRMIRHSDNASATSVLEKIGRQDLIDILTSDRLRLYDRKQNGGLWVGKAYAKGTAYQRDPLHNLSHGATVYQVVRFFYFLERGELVDPNYCEEMKQILSAPAISHKFVAGLTQRPNAEVYRKSGTWRQFHADAALVVSGEHRFIIVGLANHSEGGKWLEQLATPMHDLITDSSNPSERGTRVAYRY